MSRTYYQLAHEATKWIIGPMAVSDFIHEFLPHPGGSFLTPSHPSPFLNVPFELGPEPQLHQLLTGALNTHLTNFKCATMSLSSSRPYLAFFSTRSKVPPTQENGTTTKDLAAMELFVEVNRTKEYDPFCDSGPEFIDFDPLEEYHHLPEAFQVKVQTLGHSVYCAAQVLARQHRRHFFSMTMSGPMVRFIRWDRAGAIVSQAFDCANDPDTLWHFLWRLESLDMAQRGFDTTVDVDSARAHESAFAVAVEDRVCFELGIDRRSVYEAKRALDLHYDPEQLSVVSVTEDGAANSHCVSRSVITPSSVAGRGTKGYWSLNISTHELCFLKDTWRATRSNSELEGDIVRELCEKGVRNVPALVCHGVVASENKTQRTRTQEFISASWVKRSLSEVKLRQHIVERVHYRMVSSTLGCSLHEHDNLQELLFAAGDMYRAVLDAEEKCQRLHRDISSNNVILVRDRVSQVRKAYVIDWEHSVKTERLKVENHSISGTWQFISHRLLRQNDAAPHHIHDDIESIFWVTCWYLLLYYSTWSTEQPASRRRQMLDGSHHSFDIFADGTEKCLELMERTCLKRGLSNNPTALEWATRYAKYLSRPMLARANGIDKPVQDPKELEGMVFDLAETAPRDILKSTPNWKELKLYHPLGRNGLWPAIPSASVLDNMPASDVEEMSE